MKIRSLVMSGLAALTLALGFVPAASATSSALGEPGTLIVGGGNATEHYDWMASLQRHGQHSCGASLIASQWVLTAAHCVQDAQPGDLGLRIGSPDRTKGGTQTGVSQIVVHPNYATKNPNGDLAVLKLSEPVSNTPVSIADSSGKAGASSRIIGWGLTCPMRGCGQPPEQLQQLDTQVMSDQLCSLSSIDGKTEICTGSKQLVGSNACFGDSGGPQMIGTPGHWQLTGITSRLGSPVPVCGTAPSVYTDATAYVDWIKKTTGA